MKRIICMGNRYSPEDSAGPKVYDRLLQSALPRDTEVIDGGLAGLDLLRFFDGAECVLFVDSVSGFGRPNDIVVLDAGDVSAYAGGTYDHSSGLAYLLRVLPQVCDGAVPDIMLVGIEAGSDDETIDEAATLALSVFDEHRTPGTLFRPGIRERRNAYENQRNAD